MPLPALFGTTWNDFVLNWCLGNPPIEDPIIVKDALSALVRLWPERVATITASTIRGLLLVSPAIRDGLILCNCENLVGFGNVLRRLRNGERSAYSELTFAARIVKMGINPVLEPPLGGGFLDTLITVDSGDVYCEVIAPETSDAIEEVRIAASTLATLLRDQNPGKRVEVLLSVDVEENVSAKVLDAVRIHPDSDDVWTLNKIALISKKVAGNDPNVGPTIPSHETAAIIGAAQASVNFGVRSAGIARIPVTDARTKRLLYGESHHFSRDHMNILVMDVSKVVSSLKAWGQLIENCLTPTQNRRFGAVVLFSLGMTGNKMSSYEEWQVVRNKHAYKPIPESLLERILTQP